MRIAGAKVLLTGASGGLGEAIARELAAQGAKLALTGRRADALANLAAELPSARTLTADLSSRDELTRLIEWAGDVDVLVANAGLSGSGRLETTARERLEKMVEVNLTAPMVLTHALLPAMCARKAGQLVFVSSLQGRAATAGSSAYNATKFGLRGFALTLRAELHAQGVGVSLISPGFIREAGMFARSGVKLPPGVGTRSPRDVAQAVVKAIERNRGEIDVAPLTLRVGSTIAGVVPNLAATITRLAGGEKLAAETTAAQMRHERRRA